MDSVTGRELQVLRLIARGLTATAVARRCQISARTVPERLENAYAKLGCHDRLSAVLILQDAGLLERRTDKPDLAHRVPAAPTRDAGRR